MHPEPLEIFSPGVDSHRRRSTRGEGDDSGSPVPEGTMPFVCLGYLDAGRWASLSERERAALLEDGLAYDAELRLCGYLVGGQGLRGPRPAVTLRSRDGRVAV